jgi:hypothetical protein
MNTEWIISHMICSEGYKEYGRLHISAYPLRHSLARTMTTAFVVSWILVFIVSVSTTIHI